MVVTAQDLRAAGIDLPLFVGGAALTRKFTATRIAPEYGGVTLYAKDAMDGLDLANQLFSAVTRDGLVERVRAEQAALAASPPSGGEASRLAPAPERPRARLERVPVPTPPDLEPHVLRDVPLPHIYPYLNLQMLYGKHLGLRELVAGWKDRGEYVRSHALSALAIECAEAFAEMLHARLRTLWGFPDPPDLPISEKLKGRYRGIRVSFGYPACPNLADQQILFR